MDFGERLKAKVGPLPVWAWGLLAGGLFTIWYWVSNAGAGTATDSGVVDDSESVETGTVGSPSGDFSTVPVVPNPDQVEDENTNQEWLVQALNAAGTAGVSFVKAQIALQKYLNGQTLTTTEAGIVNKIISVVGPPPEGTQGIPEVTPPKPKPPTTKPTPIDFTTITTLSAPSSVRWRATFPVTVTVKWKDSRGHSGPPASGRVILKAGGRSTTVRLIAGSGVHILRFRQGDDRVRGDRVVLTAEFKPWQPTYKTRPSAATPKVVTLK